MTHRWDTNRCYHYVSEWTWEYWQWRVIPRSTELQDGSHYHQMLFSVIPRRDCLFNWNHFEMRLLNPRIILFIYCGLFVLILVGFFLCVVSSSIRFGQISPLAFFGWLIATSDRNVESCNRIPSNYCLP